MGKDFVFVIRKWFNAVFNKIVGIPSVFINFQCPGHIQLDVITGELFQAHGGSFVRHQLFDLS